MRDITCVLAFHDILADLVLLLASGARSVLTKLLIIHPSLTSLRREIHPLFKKEKRSRCFPLRPSSDGALFTGETADCQMYMEVTLVTSGAKSSRRRAEREEGGGRERDATCASAHLFQNLSGAVKEQGTDLNAP